MEFINGNKMRLTNLRHSFKQNNVCKKIRIASSILILSSASMLFTSCIDKSYDATDVDLTIGLGSEGLKIKLGKTEKIYLNDIIETDDNVKTDNNHCFYLTENGTADISYQVEKLSSTIDKIARVKCKYRVLSWNSNLWEQLGFQQGTEITVPAGYTLHGTAEGENQSDYSTDNIEPGIKRITRVYPHNFGAELIVSMLNSENVHVDIEKIQDFTITIPKYAHIKEVPKGWKVDGNKLTYPGYLNFDTDEKCICKIDIDYIDLKEEGIPVDGKVTLSQEMTRVGMKGTVYFKAKDSFVMKDGDYADILLDLCFNNDGEISVDSIRGIFDPEILPEIEPISIYDKMPDFLRNEDTRLELENTTIKFQAGLQSIPLDLQVGATLTSVKNGQKAWSQEVTLPQVLMKSGRQSTAYYHQSANKPYDPEGEIPADAIVQRVPDLGKLIERIPDQILVDMKGHKVSLAQSEGNIIMGKTYRSQVKYNVFIPLVAEEGFCIAYRDTTNSINSDLEDIQASGIRLKTTIENTIPLNLTLNVKALDVYGREMPGIHFTQAKAQAGKGETATPVKSDIIMEASLDNPEDLQRVDRFVFDIKAEQDSKQTISLTSQQHLRLTEIRLQLTGKIIMDMN